jgi:hypothetical protein
MALDWDIGRCIDAGDMARMVTVIRLGVDLLADAQGPALHDVDRARLIHSVNEASDRTADLVARLAVPVG